MHQQKRITGFGCWSFPLFCFTSHERKINSHWQPASGRRAAAGEIWGRLQLRRQSGNKPTKTSPSSEEGVGEREPATRRDTHVRHFPRTRAGKGLRVPPGTLRLWVFPRKRPVSRCRQGTHSSSLLSKASPAVNLHTDRRQPLTPGRERN